MKFTRIIISFIISLCVILSSFTAYAYNAEYLDPAKWVNSDTHTNSINKTSVFGQLVGEYSYFVDSDDSCIYVSFSVSEDNIDTNDDVQIGFLVTNDKDEYDFTVDASSKISSLVDLSDKFSAHASFETLSSHNGTYTVALNIHNGSKSNLVSVFFATKARYSINGLTNILVQPLETTKNTTTKKQTTKKSISDKKKSDNKKSTKATTQRSTKYYNPNPTSPSHSSASDDEIDAVQSTTIVDNTHSVPKMYSSSYTVGLVAGCVLGTAGLMFLLFGIFAKKKSNDDSVNDDDLI